MRVIVTGSKGLLGSCLSLHLKSLGINVIEADLPDYNIISINSVNKLFNPDKPVDFLINCAAYTDVPKAEVDKKTAYFLNAQACGILSRVCSDNKTHLIHFSTDFVFDGKKDSPYTESDITNPLNYYGLTKMCGENIIKNNMTDFTIFRLQWLFGQSNKTFFSKILEKSKTEKQLKIVTDEIGSPCSVSFVSKVISTFLTSKKKIPLGNTYHLTHNNFCSRYDCAEYFLTKINWKGDLIPILTTDFKDTVIRPKFGAMSNLKLSQDLGMDLMSWEEDINLFIESL